MSSEAILTVYEKMDLLQLSDANYESIKENLCHYLISPKHLFISFDGVEEVDSDVISLLNLVGNIMKNKSYLFRVYEFPENQKGVLAQHEFRNVCIEEDMKNFLLDLGKEERKYQYESILKILVDNFLTYSVLENSDVINRLKIDLKNSDSKQLESSWRIKGNELSFYLTVSGSEIYLNLIERCLTDIDSNEWSIEKNEKIELGKNSSLLIPFKGVEEVSIEIICEGDDAQQELLKLAS